MSQSNAMDPANQVLPLSLPACVIRVLGRPGWFDPAMLANVKIRPPSIFIRLISHQSVAGQQIAATTIGDIIYFHGPEHFVTNTPKGLALIAHELRHVEQFMARGLIGLGFRYLLQFARHGYSNKISYERDADKVQTTVEDYLVREFEKNQHQPACQAGHVSNPLYQISDSYPDLPSVEV